MTESLNGHARPTGTRSFDGILSYIACLGIQWFGFGDSRSRCGDSVLLRLGLLRVGSAFCQSFLQVLGALSCALLMASALNNESVPPMESTLGRSRLPGKANQRHRVVLN